MRLVQLDRDLVEERPGVHRELDVDAARPLDVAVGGRDRVGDALGVRLALVGRARRVEVRGGAGHGGEVGGGLLIAALREDAAAVEHEPDHADDCEDGEEEQDHHLALLPLPGRFVVHLALLAHG